MSALTNKVVDKVDLPITLASQDRRTSGLGDGAVRSPPRVLAELSGHFDGSLQLRLVHPRSRGLDLVARDVRGLERYGRLRVTI
mgnify:CR=1 FL=1